MASFTVDLAKLGEKESGMTMDGGDIEAESIGSEDEGPEDFTMNLEKWMRGNEIWRKEVGEDREGEKSGDEDNEQEKEDSEGDEQSPDMDDASVQAEDALQERVVDESEFEPLSTSTPAPLMNRKHLGPEKGGSTDDGKHHPPPLSRLNTEAQQNRAAEEVFEQISALQAEVEKLRLGDENNRYINEMLKRAHVSDQAENCRLKDELQNMKEDVVRLERDADAAERTIALERKFHREAESEITSLGAKLESNAKELAVAKSTAEAEKQASGSSIAALEKTLLAVRTEVSVNQNNFKAVLGTKQGEMDNLRSEFQACKREVSIRQQAVEAKLVALQTAIMKERNDFKASQDTDQVEIKNLRSELQFFKNELSSHEQASQACEADHMLEITKLLTKVEAGQDLESQLAVQKMDLDHVQEELQETRRTLRTVEHKNDGVAQENERQRKEKAEMTDLLDRRNAALRAAESTIESLRDEISRREAEKHVGTTEAEAHESELEQLHQRHQNSIEGLKTAHEKELKSLKSTILRAGDGMRKREQRLEQTHREELASLHEKIGALETSGAASRPTDSKQTYTPSVAELRATILVLCSKLSAATSKTTDSEQASGETVTQMPSAVRDLSSKLSAASAALQATRLALSESEETLAAERVQRAQSRKAHEAALKDVEAQFTASSQKREKEWRRRIALMFRDRDMMGQALLLAWGREEVGDKSKVDGAGDQRQGYRYRYVER